MKNSSIIVQKIGVSSANRSEESNNAGGMTGFVTPDFNPG
jgi:hypothetical protein